MATFLFDKIVFGPVKSRRLGVSLGINLLPLHRKICNFDCVYCECGLNTPGTSVDEKLPTREMVSSALRQKLDEMKVNAQAPDVITFAGNGEPTIHPQFAGIIDDTIAVRDMYFPKAKISVLSNATMLHKQDIVKALLKADQSILKLDSGLESSINHINQPAKSLSVSKLIDQFQQFKGKLIIQSLFTRGTIGNNKIDNTTEADITAWIESLKQIRPEMVMIYTIERDTPYEGLRKVPVDELKAIAKLVNAIGINTQVNG
ncbi:MAG TPA: radical SAM protein [Bacteroidales bacterium]|nr:radical SAM protein [Bacteroidales bacterium]